MLGMTVGVLAWGTLFAVGVSPLLLDTPIRLPPAIKRAATLFFPQGWAFFTRDPREPLYYTYTFQDGTFHRDWLPNADAANLFGLSFNAKVRTMESALLSTRLEPTAWTVCERSKTVEACLLERVHNAQTLKVNNPSSTPNYCGTVGFTRTEVTPWAYTLGGHPPRMQSVVAVEEVTCRS